MIGDTMLISLCLWMMLLAYLPFIHCARTKAQTTPSTPPNTIQYKTIGLTAAVASGLTLMYDQQRKKVALLEQNQAHMHQLNEQTEELLMHRSRPMALQIQALESDTKLLQQEKKAIQQQLVSCQARNVQLAKKARHWETQSQIAERIAEEKWFDFIEKWEFNNEANRRLKTK